MLPILIENIADIRPAKAIWGYIRGKKVRPLGILSGVPAPEGLWVRERGLRYWVEPGRSPDAGVFGDMRELRDWLRPYWEHKEILNLFCFTGAFSVAAVSGGAQSVCSVDLSSTYIDWVQKNMEGNGFSTEAHSFLVSDANKALERFRRKKNHLIL